MPDQYRFVRDLDRLGLLLASPVRYFTRRTERAAVYNRRSWRWEVSQQIEVPLLSSEREDQDLLPVDTVLSLGIYTKSRLPDLRAYDSSGNELAILARQERGEFLATIAVRGFGENLLGIDPDNNSNIFRLIKYIVTRVVMSSEGLAIQYVDTLLNILAGDENERIRRYAWNWEFLETLADLAVTTHVLFRMKACPGTEVLVSHTFTDGIDLIRVRLP